MTHDEVMVYTDGASRGNPGPAAAAFVILVDGVAVVEYAEAIGSTTNNVAEYTALVRALKCCEQLAARRVTLHSDSELIVKQMLGEYKVKHQDMIPLYEEAQDLARRFHSFVIRHVRRADNAEADRLGNEALDGRPRPLATLDGMILPPAPSRSQPVAPASDESRDDELIAVLNAARHAWSRGDEEPSTVAVLDELLARWRGDERPRKARSRTGRRRKSAE